MGNREARSIAELPLGEALMGQTEFGVAICAADGVLLGTNTALEEMLGQRYQRSAPSQWPGLCHLYDATGRLPLRSQEVPLARAVRGESVVNEVVTTRPSSGGLRFLRCNAHQLRHHDGTAAGAVVFVADATREIQDQRDVEKMRERLIETVNHEVRTPLTIIQGHAELLSEARDELPAPAHWSVDAITRALDRLETVLNSIRALTEPSEPPHSTSDPDPHPRAAPRGS